MPDNVAPPAPILSWRDSRGYDLSLRIWNTSEATATDIDRFLQAGIAEGKSSLQLARELEQFLLPGRELSRTTTPYNTDVSFYAMRLARSEVTLANSTATKIAAIANPFVDRMYYNLSAAHVGDPGDPCEEFADMSDSQNGFAPEDCPTPVESSHPSCLCYLTQGVMSESDALAMIQDDLQAQDDIRTFTDDNLFSLLELAIWGLAAEFLDQLLGD